MTSQLIITAAVCLSVGQTPVQSPACDSALKTTIKATKPDAHGVQIVTVTLDIEKGAILYANPVNHNHDFLNANATRLRINAKVKPHVDVKYPSGKTRSDGKDRYNIYDGTVTIQAVVKRAPGDASPLQIELRFLGSFHLA